MKYKAFDKVSVAVKTQITVRNKAGEYTDCFTIDYMSDDVQKLNRNILKKMDLIKAGAEVEFVSYSAVLDALTITVVV